MQDMVEELEKRATKLKALRKVAPTRLSSTTTLRMLAVLS